jgi:hypothetical protein
VAFLFSVNAAPERFQLAFRVYIVSITADVSPTMRNLRLALEEFGSGLGLRDSR